MAILYFLSLVFIVSPFFPATNFKHWFFRTPDFIRLQSVIAEVLLIVCLLIFGNFKETFDWVILTGIFFALLYQLAKILPYTKLNFRRDHEAESDGMISVLAVNVLQTNTKYADLVSIIEKLDADIVLTMETNKEWEIGLSSIEKTYPHSVKIPLENLYGMHLYSKKELKNVRRQFQVEDDIPSIYFDYAINDQLDVFFACLHPAPPSPTENDTSKEQDAELMLTGEHIRKLKKPCVVCGDMNDVVWSRTTRLFKKMTNMIDPRIGRGLFPTYHAGYRLMRFPLDHLFISEDLYVKRMERTEYFGSDHFGMYYEIYHKKGEHVNTNGQLDQEDHEEVQEIIKEGKESAKEN